jgi:hypothetical protein
MYTGSVVEVTGCFGRFEHVQIQTRHARPKLAPKWLLETSDTVSCHAQARLYQEGIPNVEH